MASTNCWIKFFNFFLRYVQKFGQSDQNVQNVCLFTESYHFVWNYMFGYRKTGTLGLLHEGTDSWDFCMPTINGSKPVQWSVSYRIPVLFVYLYHINSHIDKQTCLFLKMWFFIHMFQFYTYLSHRWYIYFLNWITYIVKVNKIRLAQLKD